MSEGRFNGLTKSQWKLLKPLMPKDDPNKKGKPHTSWKRICNSILWILITGGRWCDIPRGRRWGSKSAAHRWLGIWESDETLNTILERLRNCAELAELLNLERLAVDGFFFRRKRRG